jgi:hypothetical protein
MKLNCGSTTVTIAITITITIIITAEHQLGEVG